MKRFIVAVVTGMVLVSGLIAGCETKQAEQKPASQEHAPAKKAPVGC